MTFSDLPGGIGVSKTHAYMDGRADRREGWNSYLDEQGSKTSTIVGLCLNPTLNWKTNFDHESILFQTSSLTSKTVEIEKKC